MRRSSPKQPERNRPQSLCAGATSWVDPARFHSLRRCSAVGGGQLAVNRRLIRSRSSRLAPDWASTAMPQITETSRRAASRDALDAYLSDEPFVKAGKMRFSRVVEFHPAQFQPVLGDWFSADAQARPASGA